MGLAPFLLEMTEFILPSPGKNQVSIIHDDGKIYIKNEQYIPQAFLDHVDEMSKTVSAMPKRGEFAHLARLPDHLFFDIVRKCEEQGIDFMRLPNDRKAAWLRANDYHKFIVDKRL